MSWIVDLYHKEQRALKEALLKKEKMKTIKVFTKEGCPPCAALKPIISEFKNVTFHDAIENMSLYGLRQAPTTIVYEGGIEVCRFTGFRTKEEIELLIA